MRHTSFPTEPKSQGVFLSIGVSLSILFGWLTVTGGLAIPAILIAFAFLTPFVFMVFQKPKIGFITFIVYAFLLFSYPAKYWIYRLFME
jgi:hypothetical protein